MGTRSSKPLRNGSLQRSGGPSPRINPKPRTNPKPNKPPSKPSPKPSKPPTLRDKIKQFQRPEKERVSCLLLRDGVEDREKVVEASCRMMGVL